MVFKNLRKFTKTIMWVVAILIVPSFVIWNIGSSVRNRRSGYAGKIFEKKIPWDAYALAKRAARNDAMLKYGNKFEQNINLEEQAWMRLILLHEAKTKKIKVSNEELMQYVKNIPFFAYGELTLQSYQEIISSVFQETPAEFEDGIRGSIMMKKLMEEITKDITVTDTELKEAYTKQNEEASASYILFEPKNYLSFVSTENEEAQKNYYNGNKEEFRKPEQVIAEYIEIKLEQFKNGIEITDERIKKYYENNKDKFKNNEAPGQENAAAKPTFKPLEEVKESIKEKLIEKEMANRASETARQLLTKLYNDPNLGKAAEAFNLKAETTPPFSMLEEVPKIGLSFPFIQAAFSLKVGDISEVIKTPVNYYILKPLKKIPPHIPAYEEIKEKVKIAYTQAEAMKLAQQKAEETLKQFQDIMTKENLSFEETAKKFETTVKSSANFTRTSYINELGFSQELTQAAFSLQPNKLFNKAIRVPRGWCILTLNSITPIDEEKFKKEKEKFREQVTAEKKNRYLNEWFINLKEKAHPVSYLEENKQL